MRDTTGGISADFLHIAARQNKSGTVSREKRDCADNPLDKLPTKRRKPLKPGGLSERAWSARNMLTDVNKRVRTRGWRCVSPIHGHSDSNL
ncbi:hypothetical protein XH86_01060 [Bradyrhizobium guangdongense]|uniref:Uncharacterized protein n=1 Tax=Bradyrhizobium guangdongense TaxID=1325090 RepID=A0ABX6U807_9BRAD|nr:hypothetical protein X265_01060 [Bradyrhizobium guangdongense]QOZ57482.1 hypothetical protein XH86_01060 [Bradyrhizobium guangdongense]